MRKMGSFACTLLLVLACAAPARKGGYSDDLSREAVIRVVSEAVSWQLDHMPQTGRTWFNPSLQGWADGVFLSAAATWKEDPALHDRLAEIACRNHYAPAPKSFDPANDIAISLLYAELYREQPQPRFLKERIADYQAALDTLRGGWYALIPTMERLDFQMKYWPEEEDLDFMTVANHERWSWCDALYMAAPVYAAFANLTGNASYRDFMRRELWRTVEYLYSPSDSLFFRDSRFFDEREPNGAKVFWGRGNGWALAGLARVMDFLPADAEDRPRLEGLFREMATKLARLQGVDGFWRTSLLDPEDFPSPESSATGFLTYGLWWGINRGVLDEASFMPAARAGWKALVSAVQPGGKLGWVQPIGDTPDHISAEKNEVYGTAALVLAGNEVLKYIHNKNN